MARRLLTQTREQWARDRNHDGVMRGERLALPAGVAGRYDAKLQALVDYMTGTTRKKIEELFKHEDVQSYFAGFTSAQDISPASQARILTNQLKAQFEQIFGSKSKPIAESMVNQADAASKTNVWSSLRELSGGLSLKTDVMTGAMAEFMTATVAQNVALIKSIPAEYMMKVQGEVLRSITDGKGLEDLVPFFEDQAGVTSRRARTIAYDQTHKAYNGLNTGRMKAAGVKSFEWVHSGGGQHPRQRHIDMSGKVYSFDNLPVIEDDGTIGIPGQAINCRCTMVPVVKFDEGEAVT
jgi:SPP1 gp7 family putative phage head morphogenesis protein